VGQPAGQGGLQPLARAHAALPAGALGRTWEEAGTDLQNKTTGMFLLGSFVGVQFTDPAAHKDLDFFAFPADQPEVGQDSVEAPIDGFMLSKSPKNVDGAKALLKYLGSATAANTYLADRQQRRRYEQAHEHEPLHSAAEEVGGADLVREAHLAVPRP